MGSVCCSVALVVLTCAVASGCKTASVSEVRGKTAFGPEFRNRGNNTSEVRYDARQSIEAKWDNGWTTALAFRRRDVDDGSGDNETRGMVEVGYPLWKAPKKPDKTAERLQELQQEVQEMRARVTALQVPANGDAEPRLAQGNGVASPGQ